MKPGDQTLNRTQIQSQMSHHSPSSSGYLFIASNGGAVTVVSSLSYTQLCHIVIMLLRWKESWGESVSFIFFFKNSFLGYKIVFLACIIKNDTVHKSHQPHFLPAAFQLFLIWRAAINVSTTGPVSNFYAPTLSIL